MGVGLPNSSKHASDGSVNPSLYRFPQVPLEVERYPTPPEGLQLEQVHVYVRHGERTPVGIRLNKPPASIPEHWEMCKTARRFRSTVTSMAGLSTDGVIDEILYHKKMVERPDGTVTEGECLLGELTDLGRQTTFNFGDSLRRLYVQKLGFLPDILETKGQIYLRSTNMPRTMESLQQVVHGLYPTEKCHPASLPALLVRNGKDENLIGNTYACKRLEILQVSFAKAAAEAYNRTLEHLDKKVSKYLDGNPIRVDGKPRASGVLDTIRAAVAHGIKVPSEFEDKSIIDAIERAVVSEWFADKTEEVRRLGMGLLLDDLSRKMQQKAAKGEKDPLKILVHSTHDTAIAGLCSTLDVFDEKWPAFTASITFELFKKVSPESQASQTQTLLSRLGNKATPEHYVRMRYQNKNMFLPMCAEEGNHLEGSPEFCTLSAFRDRVKELIPRDWDTECSPAGRKS
ncbi:histidine phosphatase superfamily [Crucibulum laeve]|uniref:Histidine phosphatase superfamily n=1 Tax=Crucibulum laeve TaxID=68775 RepID=A0A5C3M8P1_9AGAR|nr:histidine phosphatase superfamily [Crucibulum laeve]